MGLSPAGVVALVFMTSFLLTLALALHFLNEEDFRGRID